MLSILSLWGMFVYGDDTSVVTRMQLGGNFDSIVLMNEVESCTYDGYCLTYYGCSQWSMNVDMFSVMLSQLETMGLIPCEFL